MREVGRGDGEPDAGDGEGGGRIDGDDPCPGDVQRHELHVEGVGDGQVGDVGLTAGDPVQAADAGRGRADARSSSGVIGRPRVRRPRPAGPPR